MWSKQLNGPLAAIVLSLLVFRPAAAQSPGTRAAGLAGAFVAVADDASSVYWNPAGMATGAYLSFVLDFSGQESIPDSDRASMSGARMVAFTLPPLGLSLYRRSQAVSPDPGTAETDGPSREDGRRSVQRLTTSTFGVTVGQSLGEYVVVAATTKLVRGGVARGVVDAVSAGEAADHADSLDGVNSTRVDVDAGLMMAAGHWRLGAVARNLTTPEFKGEPGTSPVEQDREARVGAAWGSGWPGTGRLVVSADVDLTRQASASGERRDLAAGVETWWLGQRLGLRGGVRRSTVGAARPVAAGGISAAVRPGVFVEAHVARGARDEQSWSVGARLTY